MNEAWKYNDRGYAEIERLLFGLKSEEHEAKAQTPFLGSLKTSLSESTRENDIQDFEEAFKQQYDDFLRESCTHPIASEEGRNNLIDAAKNLLGFYPGGAKYVSLGQSPALIVAIAALMKGYEKNSFDGIAFSGRWYFQDTDPVTRKRNDHLTRNNYLAPKAEKINVYKQYLSKKGMDPESICQNFTPEAPLVIVEYAQSGAGLYSFLEILTKWATALGLLNNLQGKVKIHFLKHARRDFCNTRECCSRGFQYSVQNVDDVFILALSNSDKFEDRLLPHYESSEWKSNNYPTFGVDIPQPARLALKRMTYALDDENLLREGLLPNNDEKEDDVDTGRESAEQLTGNENPLESNDTYPEEWFFSEDSSTSKIPDSPPYSSPSQEEVNSSEDSCHVDDQNHKDINSEKPPTPSANGEQKKAANSTWLKPCLFFTTLVVAAATTAIVCTADEPSSLINNM